MQNLSSTVLVALGGVLVVFGGYHALVIAPRMRRLAAAVDAHDTLLAAGSGSATSRLLGLEHAAAEVTRRGDDIDARLSALEASLARKVPHIGFVRYNAFEDAGGPDLSYALALLTKDGDGVVISSIYSREQTRTYGKAVSAFNSAQDASNEERAAIAKARESAS